MQKRPHKIEKRKDKRRDLSDKLKNPYQRTRIIPLTDYLKTKSDKYDGPLFNFVPITFLPHGKWGEVRGMYNPFNCTITIGTGPPMGLVNSTENHELAHYYGFRDETLTEIISSRPDFEIYSRAT